MRTALAIALLPLAGCGGAEPGAAADGAAAPAPGEPDNRIECRVAGAPSFARACSIETARSPEGLLLTIRKADGGFRRLLVARDERGLIAADGAEPADVALLADGRIEVSLGGDLFRLPATEPRP